MEAEYNTVSDDTALITGNEITLQKVVKELHIVCQWVRLKVNEKKK